MSIRSGLIAGAAGVLIATVIGWGFGQYKYHQGWDARNQQAALDDAQRNQAVFDERLRLEQERDYAELLYTNLKVSTDAKRNSFESVESGLRQQVATAIHQRDHARATGSLDDTGPDWIGGFAACYSEYSDLAADAAGWADQVNGLQGYINAVR